MAIPARQLPPARGTPLLPTVGVIPGSFQTLREVAEFTTLRRDLIPHLEILLLRGHRAQVTLLLRAPVHLPQIQVVTLEVIVEAAEGDNPL